MSASLNALDLSLSLSLSLSLPLSLSFQRYIHGYTFGARAILLASCEQDVDSINQSVFISGLYTYMLLHNAYVVVRSQWTIHGQSYASLFSWRTKHFIGTDWWENSSQVGRNTNIDLQQMLFNHIDHVYQAWTAIFHLLCKHDLWKYIEIFFFPIVVWLCWIFSLLRAFF